MMRCLTILVCLCVLSSVADPAKAAPATGDGTIVDNANVATLEDMPAEATRSGPVRPPAAATLVAPSEPAPASANPLWAIPLSALTATRDRPIFSPSRRPPPPPAVAPVTIMRAPPPRPTEPEKPHLTLVGTIVGYADSFGIFIDQTTKAALRLKLGEQHDGWTLRSVQKREVTLAKDRQSEVVAMPQPGRAGEGETPLLPPGPSLPAPLSSAPLSSGPSSPGPERAVAAEPNRPARRRR